MDIAIYIADLLHQQDEVSLPGIGTFFKQRINGYFDSKKDVYAPPRQFLAFRVSDTENTYLSDYLVETKKISSTSANYFIDKYAEKVKDVLATSNQIELTGLGILKKTPTGFQFEASKDFSFATDFYGLKSTGELHKPAPAPSPPIAETSVSTQNYVSRETEIETSRRGSKYTVPIILIVLVILGGLGYVFYPQYSTYLKLPPLQKQSDSSTLDGIDSTEIDMAIAAKGLEKDSAVSTTDTIATEAPYPKPDSIQNITPPVDTIPEKTTTFEIIASSLNSEAGATQIIKNFKSLGITAHTVYAKEKRKNNILISIGSFQDEATARAELAKVRKKVEKGAYIYTKKN